MKKIFLAVITLCLSLFASAQIKVVEIKREADTLMHTFSSGTEVINIYKNHKGYFLAEESTNRFDPFIRFYLGKDKSQSIQSLQSLITLCEEDVSTTINILDADGKSFVIKTDAAIGGIDRKPTFTTSTMIRITNEDMAGWVYYRKRTLEESIKVLQR